MSTPESVYKSRPQNANERRYLAAKTAAGEVFRRFGLSIENRPKVAIILGTGWGDSIGLEDERSIPLHEFAGFEHLKTHPTHKRLLCCGRLNGHLVFVLRGRVHLNEIPNSTDLADMVRQQIEMLCVLGVEKFVLTAAVGGLLRGKPWWKPWERRARVGTVCVVDGFVTLFAPDMPLYGGEFVAVEDMLDQSSRKISVEVGHEVGLDVFSGGHVMVRGPFFEGRMYDKLILARTRADVVGMSILPEACVAALYRTKVLALCFVSNDDAEEHSDELVRERAKAAGDKLGDLLSGIVSRV